MTLIFDSERVHRFVLSEGDFKQLQNKKISYSLCNILETKTCTGINKQTKVVFLYNLLVFVITWVTCIHTSLNVIFLSIRFNICLYLFWAVFIFTPLKYSYIFQLRARNIRSLKNTTSSKTDKYPDNTKWIKTVLWIIKNINS